MKEKFSRFGWEVLEHLRRMATPFVLNLMFGMTMVAILAIGVRALEIVLTVLFFAGCCFAAFIYFRAAGEAAYKMKEIGELQRRGETSSDMNGSKYRPCKEYKPYKGASIGLCVCLLPIILILVGGIAGDRTALVTMVFSSGWAYCPVFAIYRAMSGAEEFALFLLWYGFILLAVYLAVCIVAYELGARKERNRQLQLELRSARIEEQKKARLEQQRQHNLQNEQQKKTRGAKNGK